MPVALVWLLSLTVPGQSVPQHNFDFRLGNLQQWEGEGFYLTPMTGHGPSLSLAACSSDRGPNGRKALLHRTFLVPKGAGAIRFRGAFVRPKGKEAGDALDVVLESAGRKFAPREVRMKDGWKPAPAYLPLAKGNRVRDYVWPVAHLVGQTVRIAVIDQDDRPGCYVLAGGFQILAWEDFQGKAFSEEMIKLARELRLKPMSRADSKHFMAIGNTEDVYIEDRLQDCELIYSLFFPHFRKLGFEIQPPTSRMMVAVFDGQSGFEAYLGGQMPNAVTGVYHKGTNTLVVYDFAKNRDFLAAKDYVNSVTGRMANSLSKQRVVSEFRRRLQDARGDANIGTIMHEVAHQLSFNCGLLNREGDVPVWLAEGLACYCEGTDKGVWNGIGEKNPERLQTLAAQVKANAGFIPLRLLVEGDEWIARGDTRTVLLGYAQSWALFRMLLEDHPQEFKRYLTRIYRRKTGDWRLDDFCTYFTKDLDQFDRKFQYYIQHLVETENKKS